VVELWTEKERKKEEEGKKRTKQEEEYDEIFKRSKLLERSSNKREEKENGKGDRTNELIIVLKKLKNYLKQEIAELTKEVREMKEE